MQLAEVIDCLDKEYWEADLYSALEEIRDEVHAHMDISEDLTNKARGNNKSFLTAANGIEFDSSVYGSGQQTVGRLGLREEGGG